MNTSQGWRTGDLKAKCWKNSGSIIMTRELLHEMTVNMQGQQEDKWADIAKNERKILDLFKPLT